MDSLYAFKCKRFRNTRHTVTFGIPVSRDARRVDFRGLRTNVCRITNGSHTEPYLSKVKLGVFSCIMTVQNTVHVF
jgi:hypothetical protein